MAPIPEKGLVLVTGANGYIAGVTIQVLLNAGYRVRGSVRDPSKHQWMLNHYGSDFELVALPETSAAKAFDQAIKGVDGVAHLASSIAMLPELEKTVGLEIKAMTNILEAAAKEPSVRRIMYMSSQSACIMHAPGRKYHVDANTWNEDARQARTTPEGKSYLRCYLNYCCKKMEAEQLGFEWVEEHKPHFEFNSVVPNVNWGTMVRPDITGSISMAAMLKMLWDGNRHVSAMLPPMWCTDVEDTALLTMAALNQDDVVNERIIAFANQYTYKEILNIFQKHHPERKFVDQNGETPDAGTVDTARASELLKRLGKENGFSNLEEIIVKWMPWAVKAENQD